MNEDLEKKEKEESCAAGKGRMSFQQSSELCLSHINLQSTDCTVQRKSNAGRKDAIPAKEGTLSVSQSAVYRKCLATSNSPATQLTQDVRKSILAIVRNSAIFLLFYPVLNNSLLLTWP